MHESEEASTDTRFTHGAQSYTANMEKERKVRACLKGQRIFA